MPGSDQAAEVVQLVRCASARGGAHSGEIAGDVPVLGHELSHFLFRQSGKPTARLHQSKVGRECLPSFQAPRHDRPLLTSRSGIRRRRDSPAARLTLPYENPPEILPALHVQFATPPNTRQSCWTPDASVRESARGPTHSPLVVRTALLSFEAKGSRPALEDGPAPVRMLWLGIDPAGLRDHPANATAA